MVEKETLINRLDQANTRLIAEMMLRLRTLCDELKRLKNRIQDPRKGLANLWMRLDEIHSRLIRVMDLTIKDKNKRLGAEIRALRLFSPVNRITAIRQNLDFQRATLVKAIQRRLMEMQMSRSLLEKRINDLSPLSVLKRGYSITLKLPEKRVLKDASGMEQGDQVQVLLGEGELECRVQEVKG